MVDNPTPPRGTFVRESYHLDGPSENLLRLVRVEEQFVRYVESEVEERLASYKR